MPGLGEWFAGRDMIRRLYQEELGRDVVGDPDALTNWLYHWREDRQSDAWIRDRIRESPEWQARQGQQEPADSGSIRPPEDAGPPSPAIPESPVGGGGVRVLRITDERDGELLNRGYSYWSQVWVGRDGIRYVFAGHADGHPRFYTVRPDGAVMRLGSYGFPYGGTAEGWSWTPDGWIMLCEGPRLRRVDPFTGEDRVVFDITETHPGCVLFQSHSSDDGTTHCATVRQIVADGPYPNVGTVVARQGGQDYFEAHGTLDESQITPDGEWLIIKEVREGTEDAVDNRVINLRTRDTQILRDEDGAVGHSDVGPGYVVGEDNIHGHCVYWDLRQPLTPGRRRDLFSTWGMGHLSIKGGRCLMSDATSLQLVDLNGGGLTHLLDHGMTIPPGTPKWQEYDFQVFANLDHTGTVACYLSNHGGGQLDLFLVEL